jgi:hypothetical protein
MVFLGSIALVIPGIYLFIGFQFSKYILVVEGKKGWDALDRSRDYVRGRWWPVFGRFLLYFAPLYVLNLLPNFLPGIEAKFVGSCILVSLVSPFGVIFFYKIYENLVVLKESSPALVETKSQTAG